MIAGELAVTNPIQARGLLDEAFAGLRTIAAADSARRGQGSVANLMAQLLPIVEQLDPHRLAERLWLVAACRRPLSYEPTAHELEGQFALAMWVARYDRAVADVIAAAALERLPDALVETGWSSGSIIPSTVKSLTAYDPRVIAPLLRALPDAARQAPLGASTGRPPASNLRYAWPPPRSSVFRMTRGRKQSLCPEMTSCLKSPPTEQGQT